MSANAPSSPEAPAGAPPPLPHVRQFHSRLQSLLGTWRRGLLAISCLHLLTLLLLATISYAVLDYFLALPNSARQILGAALVLALATALALQLVRIFRLGRPETARRIDSLTRNRRRPVLGALELLRGRPEEEGPWSERMEGYLVKRSVDEASAELSGLPRAAVFPAKECRRQALRFLGVALLVVLATVLLWPVASVLLQRIAVPWKDVPPYSPLSFSVSPKTPEVHYGDDATVEVQITGGNLTKPVRFLTRDGDEVFETVCFRDGPNRFAQRLERVVRPTEFAFAHGKARSEWHRIDLLLEPKIALASVTVTPPDYAGLPERTFLVGEEPLAVLRGSQVRLAVTSNRPLLDGELTLSSPDEEDDGSASGVTGVKTAAQTVAFEWEAEEPASASVEIRDVRGTPNGEPLLVSQRIVPDEPPVVEVTEPPSHLMATPFIEVPVEARAEDDLGLARLELTRTVVGYRDRSEDVGPGSQKRETDYRSTLDLSALGVRSGEVVELYFEAMDSNPSLMGVAASEVSRVEIISEEEYASIIRTRTTIREFAERFQVVQQRLEEVREAVKKLSRAMEESGDDEAVARARENAAATAGDAARLFEALSEDFAAFDLEESAIERAGETQTDLEAIERKLGSEDTPLTEERIADMEKRLGGHREKYAKQRERAEEVAAVSELMAKAVEFRNLVRDQDTLTRRLKQFETETRAADVPFLEALGKDQGRMHERLERFAEDMRKRIEALPSGYDSLETSARNFLEAVERSGAASDMGTSSKSASNENGSKSYRFSALALEKLDGIGDGESESGAFCALADDELRFPCPAPLEETLSQMLSSLCLGMGTGRQSGARPGRGRGGSGGGGGGMGGNAEDGYSMAGYTALDIPVMGPPRMRLQDLPGSRVGGGDEGSDGAGSAADEVADSDRHDPESRVTPEAAPLDFGRVPNQYRDAVKRYFTPDDAPSSDPANPSSEPSQPPTP